MLARTRQPVSGRRIWRAIGMRSQSGVNDALDRLTAHGIITRAEVPPAFVYELNREHLAASAVEILAGIRVEFVSRLRMLISAWTMSPVHASIFGSFARGDGDTESDIDVLLVIPGSSDEESHSHWDDQIEELRIAIHRWTGNHASIVYMWEAEMPARRGMALLNDVSRDGILITGAKISVLTSDRETG